MSRSNDQAQAIRQNMAHVRGEFDENVEEFVAGAKNLTNWRHYVKAAPWGAVGAAAALGFVIVPRQIKIVQPNPDDIAKLAKRHQVVVEHGAKSEARSGPTQVVFTMIANALLRAATAYASQEAGKLFGSKAGKEVNEARANTSAPQPETVPR